MAEGQESASHRTAGASPAPLAWLSERAAGVSALAGVGSFLVALVTFLAGTKLTVPASLGWALLAITVLAAVAAVILLLLAALGTRRRYRVWWTALGLLGAAAVAGLVWLFIRAPDLVPAAVPNNETAQAARITAATTLRAGALAGAVGLAAIGTLIVNAVGARTAASNLELAREAQTEAREQGQRTAQATQLSLDPTAQGQVTDRYAKAIELLGDENLTVRLGGIYALARVARGSADDHATVVEILSAFVRLNLRADLPVPGAADHSGSDDPDSDADVGGAMESPELPVEPRADVLAAISVLAQLPDRRAEGIGLRADFTGLNFSGLDLSTARLTGANLARVAFSAAAFIGADLSGADLSGAILVGARLDGADLSGANLTGAVLLGAELTRADLTDAHLADADIRRGLLVQAVLTQADFAGANLTRAKVLDTDLSHAIGLSADQLNDAVGDEVTVLPDGLPRPVWWGTS